MSTIPEISDWHRHCVMMYYRKLLFRFGKDRLLKVIPRLKPYVWNPDNLKTVEAHL